MSQNPYAAPETNVNNPMHMGDQGSAFTDNGILFLRSGFVSPAICIKSGEKLDPSTKQYKISVSYLHPVLLVFFLIGLPGLIILWIIQKKLRLKVYLSEGNAKKFKRNKRITWGSLLLSFILFVSSTFFDVALVNLGLAVLFFSLIWSVFTNRLLKVRRYKNNFFETSKAHPDFIAAIPPSSYTAGPNFK